MQKDLVWNRECNKGDLFFPLQIRHSLGFSCCRHTYRSHYQPDTVLNLICFYSLLIQLSIFIQHCYFTHNIVAFMIYLLIFIFFPSPPLFHLTNCCSESWFTFYQIYFLLQQIKQWTLICWPINLGDLQIPQRCVLVQTLRIDSCFGVQSKTDIHLLSSRAGVGQIV